MCAEQPLPSLPCSQILFYLLSRSAELEVDDPGILEAWLPTATAGSPSLGLVVHYQGPISEGRVQQILKCHLSLGGDLPSFPW